MAEPTEPTNERPERRSSDPVIGAIEQDLATIRRYLRRLGPTLDKLATKREVKITRGALAACVGLLVLVVGSIVWQGIQDGNLREDRSLSFCEDRNATKADISFILAAASAVTPPAETDQEEADRLARSKAFYELLGDRLEPWDCQDFLAHPENYRHQRGLPAVITTTTVPTTTTTRSPR